MKISYNWLKWYIPEVSNPEKLADVFAYHICEVESAYPLLEEERASGEIDTIFDLKILPDRAHDLLSHQGVARELASLLNIKFTDPISKYKIPSPPVGGGVPDGRGGLKIEIKTEKCRRYMGRIARNVKVEPSPEWVVKHLESIGQRSINNLVDATNIVMFDSGQPTHIFDLDKVNNGLIIRQAKDGEEITTLDNRDCKLRSSDLIITTSPLTPLQKRREESEILAIAGIKGGKIAEVDEGTKNIILEVANFDPISVRKTAQALNITTDAKKRFENDLSPELCPSAMRELSSLIYKMCPEAIFEDIVDMYPKKQEVRKLSFSVDKISKILGINVSIDEIKDILKRYKIDYKNENNVFEITVPPMRLDLAIEEDMAEEIGRIMGYDKIKSEIPKIDFKPKQNEIYSKILYARNKLIQDGYSEVMNTSFSDKGEVSVLASASDKNFLRTNLTNGLKESLKLNQINIPFLGMKEIKIFEIGTVFKEGMEEMRVAYGDKKEIKEMSLDEFYFPLPEYPLGGGGQIIHLGENATPQEGNHFKMWSLFPFIARDIAVWTPENVKSFEVEKIIKENAGEMVARGPELFDEFKKDGKISYAFRLVFQSYERTLTDSEINEIMNKINEKIGERDDWQVR